MRGIKEISIKTVLLFIFLSAEMLFGSVGLYKHIDLSDNPVTECRLSVGDLTGDGKIDFLFNDGRRVIKAFDWDGNLLWEKFNPNDPGVEEKYHNFTLAIYDIDLDCHNEVIAFQEIDGKNCLVVLDGKTGEIKAQAELPFAAPRDHEYWGNSNYYMQDHIAIANLRGKSIPQDILAIHASKQKVAAYKYTEKGLELMWYWISDTDGYASGHFSYPYDIDNDGKDEVIAGVDVLDSDGTRLWRMDLGPFNPAHPEYGSDHVDAASCTDIDPDVPGNEIAVSSATGMWLFKNDGTILWHYPSKLADPVNGVMDGEGVQELLVGNFRPDIPGKEIVFYSEQMSGPQSVVMTDKDGNFLIWGDQKNGPRRVVTCAMDWDGDRTRDEIYSRKGIFDGNFNRVSYSMNWSFCNTGDGTDVFSPVVCDVGGDQREEIIWYDSDEILILDNTDPLIGKVLPSPWNYLKYRLRVANDNHASSMYFDWSAIGNNPDQAPPDKPGNITGSNQTEESLTLTWEAPGPDERGKLPMWYKIYRDGKAIGITDQLSFIDKKLSGGSSYKYEVYSMDESGNMSKSPAVFDFETLYPHSEPSDDPTQSVSAEIYIGRIEPTGQRILPITLVTSQTITKLPEKLILTLRNGEKKEIVLSGPVPGTKFEGFLELDNTVCAGKALFSLPQGALMAEDNSTGNTISTGKEIVIDNLPPPKPSFIQIVDE